MKSVENLKTTTLKKGISEKNWNLHLPNPLKPLEKVWIHQDQSGIDQEKYLRIIHSDELVASVFSKNYFE
jgi:hypothetical protein